MAELIDRSAAEEQLLALIRKGGDLAVTVVGEAGKVTVMTAGSGNLLMTTPAVGVADTFEEAWFSREDIDLGGGIA